MRHVAQRKVIAMDPSACDHSFGALRHVGEMAKLFAGMDVRDVHLDHPALECVQRIEDRDGGMTVGARVDDDPGGIVARRRQPLAQNATDSVRS